MSSQATISAAPESARRSERSSRGGRGTPEEVNTTTVLGGEPHVSLLPPEVNDFQKAKAARRRLNLAVVLVLILVVAAVAGAYLLSVNAQVALDAATAQNNGLIAQESEFSELKQVQGDIELIQAGQVVGAAPEIDWKDYLGKLQQTLPGGVAINGVAIESTTPLVDFPQSTVPLQGSRVATLNFRAISPTLPSIPDWLDGLATLVGFVDAVPNSVSIQPDGTYLVDITMHINQDAFSLRFPEGVAN